MKTESKFAGLAFFMALIFAATLNSNAQGRGHAKGHTHHPHHHGKHHQSYRGHYCCDHHRCDAPPPWVYERSYRPRTRYIYFQDYNTYYDYQRHVYVSLSGRNWTFSAQVPEPMRRVDVRRVVYVDVDYRGDDVYRHHVRHAHSHYGHRH